MINSRPQKALSTIWLYGCLSLIITSTLVKAENTIDKLALFQQVKGYFENPDSKCRPKFEVSKTDRVVSELLSIKENEVKEILYHLENEVSIFLERPKHMRPGLSLNIELQNNKCRYFSIYEIMH